MSTPTEGRKHKWRGCRSFLVHNKATRTVSCRICGRSNTYVVREEYPYVNFKGWYEGRMLWLLIALIPIIPATIVALIILLS